MTAVVAFVPDLMDRSKVATAAADRVRFVALAGSLAIEVAAAPTDLVVVDLARPGVLEAVAEVRALDPRPRMVGFGSHVDRDLLDAGLDAGCDEVFARSAFFARLNDLLA